MASKKPKNSNSARFVALFAIVALAAVAWHSTTLDGKRRQVNHAYRQAQAELAQLNEELTGVRSDSATAGEALATLRREVKRLQKNLEDAVTQLTSAAEERDTLQNENINLVSQVEVLNTEKQQLEAKYATIKELRLAIREIRQKTRERRSIARRERKREQRFADARELQTGNRGYVVREGQSTLLSGQRLHVRVLEPQSQ